MTPREAAIVRAYDADLRLLRAQDPFMHKGPVTKEQNAELDAAYEEQRAAQNELRYTK